MAAKVRTISKLHGPITSDFLSEIQHYQLQFLCEQCVFFNTETEECAHGFPNEAHREAYFAPENQPEGKVLIFCREFDMT